MIDKEKTIEYWRSHAEYDLETAQSMQTVGRYPYCLYMCHLAIEKILKGIVVEVTDDHAPYTHDLIALGDLTGIVFSDDQKKLLVAVNEFNMEARYPDWKDTFYKLATQEFTERYLSASKELYLWLSNYLKK